MAGFKEGALQLKERDLLLPSDVGTIKLLADTTGKLYTVNEFGVSARIGGDVSGSTYWNDILDKQYADNYTDGIISSATFIKINSKLDSVWKILKTNESLPITPDVGMIGINHRYALNSNIKTSGNGCDVAYWNVTTSGGITSGYWSFENKTFGSCIVNLDTNNIDSHISAVNTNWSGSPVNYPVGIYECVSATNGTYYWNPVVINKYPTPDASKNYFLVVDPSTSAYTWTNSITAIYASSATITNLSGTSIHYTSGSFDNVTIKSFGGTSAQFVKGDGSLDSTKYWTSAYHPTTLSAYGISTEDTLFDPIYLNNSVGVIDSNAPSFLDNNNGTCTIGSCNVNLRDNTTSYGRIKTYNVSSKTFTIPADGNTYFIEINYNSGNPTYQLTSNAADINDSTIVAIYSCWRVTTSIGCAYFGSNGTLLSNKINYMIDDTKPYSVSNGSSLRVSEVNRLWSITSATIYSGTTKVNVPSITASNTNMYACYHSSGSWIYTSGSSLYDNLNYDDGTNLRSLGNNKWAVRWIYRAIGKPDRIFYTLGSASYNTSSTADIEQPRTDLPKVIIDHCILVGKSIIQYNAASGITRYVISTAFSSSSVTNHNDLNGILGDTPYYHLGLSEYNLINSIEALSGSSGLLKLTSGTPSLDTNSYAIARGTSAQFLKGDGSLDSSHYLTSNQNIILSGDATGTGSSAINVTLANVNSTSGLFGSSTNIPTIVVNNKGLITSATNTPINIAHTQISDWTLATSKYLSANQTITLSGDATGSGTSAINVVLSTINNTPGTYGSTSATPTFLVNGKGLVTSAGLLPIIISHTQVNDWNSATSQYLSANQVIILSGDVSGSGTSGIGVTLANVNNTPGSIGCTSGSTIITTNSKGLVTSAAIVPIQIVENQVTGLITDLSSKMTASNYPDLGAIEALSGTSGLLRKTAENTWKLDTSAYLTSNQSITLSGDATGSGTSAITVSLSTVNSAPGIYGSVSAIPEIVVNGKGLVTSATSIPIAIAHNQISDWNSATSQYLSANQPIIITGAVSGSGSTNINTAYTNAYLSAINQSLTTTSDPTFFTVNANTFNGSLSGNASSSNVLSNARVISMSGDGAWSVSFDGSTNVTSAFTLSTIISSANSIGSSTVVPIISYDSKGRLNFVTSAAIQISESQVTNLVTDLSSKMTTANYPDLGAIEALSGTSGLLRKTGTNIWTLDTTSYLSGNQIITISGDATGSGTSAIGLTLATVNNTTGTFGNSSSIPVLIVNNKGLITSASNQLVSITHGQISDWNTVTSHYLSANQNITVTGDVSGSGTSAINLSLPNIITAGTTGSGSIVPVITYDQKGRLTSVTSAAIQISESQVTGLTTDLASKMTTSNYPDLVAIEALTGTYGSLKKTAANTWALDTTSYLSANPIITLSGDATGSGASKIGVVLANVNNTSGTFGTISTVPRIVVNNKGLITSASSISIQISESQVNNLTSDLNSKLNTVTAANTYLTISNPTFSGVLAGPQLSATHISASSLYDSQLTNTNVLISSGGTIIDSQISNDVLMYLNGTSANIQNQFNRLTGDFSDVDDQFLPMWSSAVNGYVNSTAATVGADKGVIVATNTYANAANDEHGPGIGVEIVIPLSGGTNTARGFRFNTGLNNELRLWQGTWWNPISWVKTFEVTSGGELVLPLTMSGGKILASDSNHGISETTIPSTYLNGLSANIQDQINNNSGIVNLALSNYLPLSGGYNNKLTGDLFTKSITMLSGCFYINNTGTDNNSAYIKYNSDSNFQINSDYSRSILFTFEGSTTPTFAIGSGSITANADITTKSIYPTLGTGCAIGSSTNQYADIFVTQIGSPSAYVTDAYLGNIHGNSISTYSISTSSVVISGGTSSQFLKADGSLDSNVYITNASSISGNAATATKLATARTIALSGDGSWSVSFDGSANVSGALTLATLLTAGSAGSATAVPTLTWDAKGRLTAVGSATISIPHTQINDWSTATSSYWSSSNHPTVLYNYGITSSDATLDGRYLQLIGGILTGSLFGVNSYLNANENTQDAAPVLTLTNSIYTLGTTLLLAAGTGSTSEIGFSNIGKPAGNQRWNIGVYNDIFYIGGNPTNNTGNLNPYTFSRSGNLGVYGSVTAASFIGPLSGNASTASKLATARTISMSGDGTWSTSFDGSANTTGVLTLATLLTAGSAGSATTVPTLTWDAKGRLTAVGSAAISISHSQINDWSTATSGFQSTLGFTPIQQGGGTAQGANKIYIGWGTNGVLRLQVDATNFGGNWPIDISGTASVASSVAWTSVTGRPTALSSFTNDAGYLTANQSISLKGAVTGSGTTSIATSFANTHLAGIDQDLTTTSSPTFTGLITANGGIKSSAAAALSLTANGSGTYMTSVLYQDASGVYLERGLASESGSASPLPFYVSKRGGGLPYPFLVNANDVTTNTMLYANGGISGNLTGHASLDLPLTGGTLTGSLYGLNEYCNLNGNSSTTYYYVGSLASSGNGAYYHLTVMIQGGDWTQAGGLVADFNVYNNSPRAVVSGMGTFRSAFVCYYNSTTANFDFYYKPTFSNWSVFGISSTILTAGTVYKYSSTQLAAGNTTAPSGTLTAISTTNWMDQAVSTTSSPTFASATIGNGIYRAYAGANPSLGSIYAPGVVPGEMNYVLAWEPNGSTSWLSGIVASCLCVNGAPVITATSTGASVTGNLTASGNVGITGNLDLTASLYLRSDVNVLNAAGNGWNTWLNRNNGSPIITATGGFVGNLTGTASNASALGGVAADYFVQGSNASRTQVLTDAVTSQSQLLKSGFYSGKQWTDAPVTSTWTHLIHCQYGNDGGSTNNWSFDIAANFGSAAYPGSPESYYVRAIADGTSTGWRTLIHSANYPSFNNFTSGLSTTSLSATSSVSVGTGNGKISLYSNGPFDYGLAIRTTNVPMLRYHGSRVELSAESSISLQAGGAQVMYVDEGGVHATKYTTGFTTASANFTLNMAQSDIVYVAGSYSITLGTDCVGRIFHVVKGASGGLNIVIPSGTTLYYNGNTYTGNSIPIPYNNYTFTCVSSTVWGCQ